MKPLFGAYWTEEEVSIMKRFDNSGLKELFLEYDILAKEHTEKYNSRAATYRLRKIAAFVNGKVFDDPKPARNA